LNDLNFAFNCLYVVKQANYKQLFKHHQSLLIQQLFSNSYQISDKLSKKLEQCNGSILMRMQSTDFSLSAEQISDDFNLKNQPQFVVDGLNSLLLQLLSQVVTLYFVRKAFQWKYYI